MTKRYKISFPRYGKYTDLLFELFRDLGGDIVMPSPITKRTVELGTKYSPGDVCYPFKITLGTMMEAVEAGAEGAMMVNTDGWCILRCYSIVQEQIIKNAGYDFKMFPLNVRKPANFYYDLRRINPSLTPIKLIKEMMKFFKKVRKLDEAEAAINRDSDIRIGIAGEVYVCNETTINMDIVARLHKMGVFVDRWLCLSNNVRMLFQDMLGITKVSRYTKKAREYFPQRIGGHANENLSKLIRYAEEGYDGAIILKPFACNPETVIEPIVEKISCDYDIPVLYLSIDESTLETHFQTRVESFVDMLRMRRKVKCARS